MNTEQLKRELEIVNRKIEERWERDKEIASKLRERRRTGNPASKQEMVEVIIFSMDVVALYPSILKDIVPEAIRKGIEISSIK